MHISSNPARGGGKRRGRAVGQGVAAVIVATGLVATAAPAAHSAPSPAAAPGSVAAGSETDTPELVTGLDESANGKVAPTRAARGFLAANTGKFHIDNPGQNLEAAGTESKAGQEVVRLQQQYQGIDVLGGQYLVRMEKSGGERTVTGTSGKYFTELDLDSVTPQVSEKIAIERAVAVVATQPGGMLRKDSLPQKGDSPRLTGQDNGLVVLPKGDGVLTRHITVTGVSQDGEPVKQEVYVDANAGFPVLQYSSIKTFGATGVTTPGAVTGDAGDAPDATTDATPGSVMGTGVRYNGETVEVGLYETSKGPYELRDYSRRDEDAPFSGQMITTYDANGAEAAYASGVWPSQATVFQSETADLGAEFTDSGAIDAHWAAGQVYDYYKSNFDRAGLDGTDEYINSIVGVTSNGGPYNNAFWDGTKMVYGQGGGDYRTFSADTDVVGHEMTHGVVEHTANLVYAGQSGAMNEAIADYFGNAIDLEANGISMDDPDAGLLGEDLCVTTAPRDCALRDLDNDLTTYDDLVGTSFRGDNGGVHLNSPIFSGALWDIRQDLGTEFADQIVYRALSGYMTALDGFTEGRAAVIAAAEELGATKAQVKVIEAAFARHGITPGWETRIGVDTDTILSKVNIYDTGVGAGGGKYAVSRSNEDGSEPYSVWLGNTSGQGTPKLMSANNGAYNVYADTDGKTVVWAEYSGGSGGIRIMSRPVAGGIAKLVPFSHAGPVSSLAVDGDLVVETVTDYTTGTDHVAYVNTKTGDAGLVDPGTPAVVTGLPSVHDGKIAYAKLWAEPDGYKLGVEVFDTAAGTKTMMPVDPAAAAIGQTAVTDDGVVWIEDMNAADGGQAAVKRADFDGSNPVTLSPEAGSGFYAATLTSSGDTVTITSMPPATTWENATLPKLFQVAADGKGGAQRVSCNSGDQAYVTADEGTRVLWLDGTTGFTNLVKRDRPAGKCLGDIAKPKLSISPAKPTGKNGWYKTKVKVNATANASVQVRVGSGSWNSLTGPTIVTRQGVTTIQTRAVDGFEISPTVTKKLKVDTVRPGFTKKIIKKGTKKHPKRMVRLSGRDATSGMAQLRYRVGNQAWKTYRHALTMPRGTMVRVQAFDKAGNVSKVRSFRAR